MGGDRGRGAGRDRARPRDRRAAPTWGMMRTG
jgi:hypothetical protein